MSSSTFLPTSQATSQATFLAQAIQSLLAHQELPPHSMHATFGELFANQNPIQGAAFLALLKSKGESVEEIVGIASYLLERAIPVPLHSDLCIDIVGTGGDGARTVNLSTGSAILTAACGLSVAKHGNRAVSSQSGSADVLEELGVEIDLGPEQIAECIRQVGIGFIFAQKYHPSLQQVASLRRSLNIPTLFNTVGPLINPARPRFALIGVGQKNHMPLMAKACLQLGFERALVFHGNGLDELSPLGPISAVEVNSSHSTSPISPLTLDPVELGLARCELQDLVGGSPFQNAQLLQDALSGKWGPIADTLILNTGVALWISGTYPTVHEGVRFAKEVHAQGLGLRTLEKWINFSQKLKKSEAL